MCISTSCITLRNSLKVFKRLWNTDPEGFSHSQARVQSVDLSAQTYWVPDSSASHYLNYGAGASEVRIYTIFLIFITIVVLQNIHVKLIWQVEIDLLSGAATILQTDIIYDCGRSLNPAVDLGQVGQMDVELF